METFTNQPIIETVKSIKIGFDKSVYLKWKGLVYSQYKWICSQPSFATHSLWHRTFYMTSGKKLEYGNRNNMKIIFHNRRTIKYVRMYSSSSVPIRFCCLRADLILYIVLSFEIDQCLFLILIVYLGCPWRYVQTVDTPGPY